MDSASMRQGEATVRRDREIGWAAVATWLLGFGLVAYLGLDGGGYDLLVYGQVGIAVWWLLLAGVAIGVFPRGRHGRLAWIAIGSLAAFVVWTALSLGWTESGEKTAVDLARVVTYLGVFCLAIFGWTRADRQRLVGAVAAAIALIALVALLSRLHPAWFPAATQAGRFLVDSRERLSYPLNYWNGLGALVAIGLPLMLQIAAGARAVALRAVATAALPALALTLFFSLSRGGIAAAILALFVFLAVTSDRVPKFSALLIGGTGAAVLVVAADRRDALQHGLSGPLAHSQGDQMLVMTLVVCLVAGLVQAAVSGALQPDRRPSWSVASRRQSLVAVALALLAVVVVAAAVDVPQRVAHGWDEFSEGGKPGQGTERLGSLAGQGRYAFWRAAIDENRTEPLIGTGSGTFEYWWARNASIPEVARDTHSLYLQTLGELGAIGLAVLLAFLLTVLVGGAWRVLHVDVRERAAPAAALAGCTAFCLTAGVDWMWQIPVLPVVLLLLGSTLVGGVGAAGTDGAGGFRLPVRIVFAAAAIAAIAAIAIPFTSTGLVRQSEADVRAGGLPAALDAARTAQSVEPGAASPRLQQALVLEAEGDLPAASAAARGATEKESTNWHNWLVLSRVEVEQGHAAAAVSAYRRARSLNPQSPLFDR